MSLFYARCQSADGLTVSWDRIATTTTVIGSTTTTTPSVRQSNDITNPPPVLRHQFHSNSTRRSFLPPMTRKNHWHALSHPIMILRACSPGQSPLSSRANCLANDTTIPSSESTSDPHSRRPSFYQAHPDCIHSFILQLMLDPTPCHLGSFLPSRHIVQPALVSVTDNLS
jgi:hypothetical protein